MAVLVAVIYAMPAEDVSLEEDLETAQQFYNQGYGGYENEGYGYRNDEEIVEKRKQYLVIL